MAPPAGSLERTRLQEWLNFIATEIHKGFTPLFTVEMITKDPKAQEEIETFTKNHLAKAFDTTVKKMGSQQYLMPQGFTVADAYLFTVLSWAKYVELDLSKWPTLVAYIDRVKARPGVQRALRAEGLA
jgi:glutathione S-transferase